MVRTYNLNQILIEYDAENNTNKMAYVDILDETKLLYNPSDPFIFELIYKIREYYKQNPNQMRSGEIKLKDNSYKILPTEVLNNEK